MYKVNISMNIGQVQLTTNDSITNNEDQHTSNNPTKNLLEILFEQNLDKFINDEPVPTK